MATGLHQQVADLLSVLPHNWHKEAMSERELVALGIGFANRPTYARWLSFMQGSKRSPRQVVAPGGKKAMDQRFARDVAEEHAAFVAALSAILDGTASAELKAALADQASKMILLPSIDSSTADASVQHHYLPTHVSAVLAYICLLVQRETTYKSDICQCRLPSCRRFFFSSARRRKNVGAMPRKYCSRAHMTIAHDQNGPVRVAKSRKDRAEQKVMKA